MIKFVSDLRQVGGFLRVSSTNKTDHRDMTEILLKVALNTITLTLTPCITYYFIERKEFNIMMKLCKDQMWHDDMFYDAIV